MELHHRHGAPDRGSAGINKAFSHYFAGGPSFGMEVSLRHGGLDVEPTLRRGGLDVEPRLRRGGLDVKPRLRRGDLDMEPKEA